MTMLEDARAFFNACETGKGWSVCRQWCHASATFSCQADALANVKTIEKYCTWMAGLLTPIPKGSYEMKSFAADPETNTVCAFAVFHGTHTAEGGPVPPTGKTVASDYVYVMAFDGGRIRHMTKIWNDMHALRGLGWA